MNESYGYGGRDTLYYAQTMFGAHRGGMDYGNVGNPNLGVVTDINSQDDQTFNPEAIGYLDQTDDVPAVGQAIPNMMPQYGATAPPSRQTARPNEAPPRPSVIALDPYEHARQQARRNADIKTADAGASTAPAVGAGASGSSGVSGSDAMGLATAVFGLGTSIAGSIVQSRAIKSQAAMASQAAAQQLALVEAQARLAQLQSQVPAAPGTPWGTIFLGLGGLVVVGGGMYMLVNRKKKKKKVAAPAGV